jgi:hypothetical protein
MYRPHDDHLFPGHTRSADSEVNMHCSLPVLCIYEPLFSVRGCASRAPTACVRMQPYRLAVELAINFLKHEEAVV